MLVLIDCYGCEHIKTMDCHLSCAHKDAPIRSRRTNADRIRAMSDEELSEFLNEVRPTERFLTKTWLEWLKKEVDDG